MARSRLMLLALALLLTVSIAASADSPAPAARLVGFSSAGSESQRALETRFDALLDARDLRGWMERLTAHPHHVGSEHGRANAEYLAGLFRSWGWETTIEEFQVLFPTPKERRLERVAPRRFVARLAEPAMAEDPTSKQTDEQLPSYNAYSIDGDVEGELVYVNYGVPDDYDELALRGIDVAGKIVLARYGGAWRGIKPKVAAEHGAIGCIIYSDPRGDGYFGGDAYPKGGWRPAAGTQRGSVADMPLFAGDPLTPGVGATADAKRLDRREAPTITKIPVLPISAADAQPLLAALGGPMAPEAWRGALPLPYHLGPGPARAHLKVAFDWRLVPARDVIARLPGAELPDEWIVRGNHHDGWVYGATDPVSGLVAELADAEALGALAAQGMRPARTLIYAAWDGEEPGLLGSTEWAETHAEELRRHAAVYVNSDSNTRGFLGLAGSHGLERLMTQIARVVPDPKKQVSVGERLRANALLHGDENAKRDARERADLRLEPLGSGSDYTPFLQHLGIASLSIGFGGEEEYGQYHSIYDSLAHFDRFVDPDHAYGVALAQVAGRTVLRLANAGTLPFVFGNLAESIGRYIDEVEKLAEQRRQEAEERARALAEKLYEADATPYETRVAPPPLPPVPYLNFAPLENAVAALRKSAEAYDAAQEALAEQPLAAADRAALDAILIGCEPALTRPTGLPGHPWFVHQIYAPGLYTGYGVKTLPAVREALELRRYAEAEAQVPLVAGAIDALAHEIDRATALLGGAAARR